MKKIIRSIGSLAFAVFLLIGLMIILTFSTLLESRFGTPFAQENFYTAHWFDFFLGLVWLNIFCATLTRWPFKRKHIGFVITHVGILMLLIGSLQSRLFGTEGQLALFERQKKSFMDQDKPSILAVFEDDSASASIELKNKNSKLNHDLILSDTGITVHLDEIATDKKITPTLKKSSSKEDLAACELVIQSSLVKVEQTVTLMQKDKSEILSDSSRLGPAVFSIKNLESTAKHPVLTLKNKQNGKRWQLPIQQNSYSNIEIVELGLTLLKLDYFPRAIVKNSKIENADNPETFNPAIVFQVRSADGKAEDHTRFYLFPDFGSLRGGSQANFFNLEVDFWAPSPENLSLKEPSLTIYHDPQKGWFYESRSAKHAELNSGIQTLKEGQIIKTGWMDMSVTAKKLIDHAVLDFEPITHKQTNSLSAKITINEKQKTLLSTWVSDERACKVMTSKGLLRVGITKKKADLPFSLGLFDFRKIDYPGTSNAYSFESDVMLEDLQDKTQIHKTISMNKPLDYKGYRIFQSSYMHDPELGEGSVFTVAKNPGIPLIYMGAVLILVGVIILFYLHPFFNRSLSE